MDQFQIVCIGGPSGVGKDTIVTRFLEKRSDYVRVPRITTRPPRSGEINGFHYRFIYPSEFESQKDAGEILIHELFCGEYYGINTSLISSVLTRGNRVIGTFGTCSIDLRSFFKRGCSLIYLSAPRHIIAERMRRRGDQETQIQIRLKAVEREYHPDYQQHFDYILDNTVPVDETVFNLLRLVDGNATV